MIVKKICRKYLISCIILNFICLIYIKNCDQNNYRILYLNLVAIVFPSDEIESIIDSIF